MLDVQSVPNIDHVCVALKRVHLVISHRARSIDSYLRRLCDCTTAAPAW